jgi:integrase
MANITQTFEHYITTRRLERNTQKAYFSAMRHVIRVFGDVDVKSLSEDAGTRLMAHLRSLSPSSANQVLTTVKIVFKGCCVSLNVKGVRVKSNPRNFLDMDERDAMLDQVTDLRHRAILSVAVYTGVRKSELFALTRDDIDLQGKTLAVRRSMESMHTIKDYGKTTSSFRQIPLCNKVVDILTEYLKDAKGPEVFQPTASEFTDPTKHILKLYTQKKVCWHSLRNTFACALIVKNVSLVKIAWLLGHSKVSPALFRYARISQTSQLYEEVNLL